MFIMPTITTRAELYSEALGRDTRVTFVLPGDFYTNPENRKKKYKSVFVLPGGCDTDLDTILQLQPMYCYDREKYSNMILVFPSGDLSYWADYKMDYRYANQYCTYLTKELLGIVRGLFPVSDRAVDTALCGMSAGGWGAYYCGLNNPQLYGHIATESGMLDLEWSIRTRPHWERKHKRQFGSNLDIAGTEYDTYALTRRLNDIKAAGGQAPRIYQGWGAEDYLREMNLPVHEHLKSLPYLDYTYKEIPGRHGWGEASAEGFYNILNWLADYWNKEEQ